MTEQMTKRKRAIDLANKALGPIEAGKPMPDAQIVLGYALILVLADIGEQLENISEQLPGGIYYAKGK